MREFTYIIATLVTRYHEGAMRGAPAEANAAVGAKFQCPSELYVKKGA